VSADRRRDLRGCAGRLRVGAPAVVSRHPVEMRAGQSYEAARAWAPLPGAATIPYGQAGTV